MTNFMKLPQQIGDSVEWIVNIMRQKFKLEDNVIGIIFTLIITSMPLIYNLCAKLYARFRPQIYLRDFAVFTTDNQDYCMHTFDMLKMAQDKQGFSSTSLNFLRRICIKNGISHQAQCPPNLIDNRYTVNDAREEFEWVCYGIVDDLLKKNHLKPTDIDILVTGCSLFNPVPSMSSMIVNHFKMKETIKSYSLGGMGCSSSPVAMEIAQSLLKTNHKLKWALVVNTENLTQNFYKGEDRGMLLPDSIFRSGCAAILVTNRKSPLNKYQLKEIVRTHTGKYSGAYGCVYQTTDNEGITGVKLEKSITSNAMKALQINMITVFLHNLPIHILIKYLIDLFKQQFNYYYQTKVKHISQPVPMPFMPDVKNSIQHFCFHTGGRAVLDGMQFMFKLSDQEIEASRAALYHYGNTSSASVWYDLAYHESQKWVKKGNIVWQIAFGSGFKCNSMIWKAIKDIQFDDEISWFDKFDKGYKVDNKIVQMRNISEEQMKYRYEDKDIENLQKQIKVLEQQLEKKQQQLQKAKETEELFQQQEQNKLTQ